jgi:hypothetical protein
MIHTSRFSPVISLLVMAPVFVYSLLGRSYSDKKKVIDPVLAPMLEVPYGLRHLLQAGFKRASGSQIFVEKMP